MSAKVSAAEEARRSAMSEHAKAERARLGLTKAQWKERNRAEAAKAKGKAKEAEE